MKKNILKTILILVCSKVIFSQSAGAPFLLIPPSPIMNGLGGIGVCLPSNDPFSGYFNPANGLDFSKGIAYSHSKMETPWIVGDFYLEYEVWNLGLIPENYPLKFILSFHKTSLIDLSELYHSSQNQMKTDAITFGIGYKGQIYKIPFDFSLGYSGKKAVQKLEYLGKSSDNLKDYGLLCSFLFSIKHTAIRKFKKIDDSFDFYIKPSFGYSVSNIGKDIVFSSASFSSSPDPIPKYLRIGVSATTVLSYKSKWNLLEWKGGRSASDILVEPRYSTDEPIKYQSGLGDIDFFNNVLKSNTDSLITIHRGDEWTILDIYTFRKGRKIDISGRVNFQTSGYGYRLAGVFKILFFLLNDPIFEKIPEFIDVQYNCSEWKQYPNQSFPDTEFKSLSITFNNIDRFIMSILK